MNKLKFILILFFSLVGVSLSSVSAQSGQISLNIPNATIEQVLNGIEAKSSYRFLYNKEIVNVDKHVDGVYANKSVSEILNSIFRDSNISPNVIGNQIVLSKKEAADPEIRISGKVSDSKGVPIIGAAIKVIGTTNGTITNYNGEFSLRVAPNAQLQISSIGYNTMTVDVANKTAFNVVMQEDTKSLEEVVVTALGIKRQEKALGYETQTVSGSDLQHVAGTNLGSSLTGKVSGLLVKNPTDFGVTPTILIRGESPLIVVDGVPYTNLDISDLSADDIESMTFLKGSTSSALYGYKGQSGAILVTTKNGSQGAEGMTVSVNSNTMFTAGFLAIPEKQSMYGRGNNNFYDKNATASWGGLMDGSIQNQWDPYAMEYKDYEYLPSGKDNFKNFLESGYVSNNNVGVSYKTEHSSIRTSLNWIGNKGQYPNSRQDIYNFTVGGDINYGKFSLSSNVGFSRKTIPNLGSNGYTSYDIMYSVLIYSPADFNLLDYKDNYWMIKDQKQNYTYQSSINNPYYDRYEKINESQRNIFNSDVTASYEFTKWLKLTSRTGLDYFTNQGRQRVAWGSYVSLGNTGFPGQPYPWNGTTTGAYNTGKTQGISINSDLMLSGNQSFDKLGLEYLLGGAINYYNNETLFAMTAGGISIPGYYSLKASVNAATVGETREQKQVNSLYGRIALSWDNLIYLDATARNDWASTLSVTQRSYFYPSIGGSFVVSQLLPDTKNWLDLLKLRASWAQTKQMAGIYQINPVYSTKTGVWGTLSGATAATSIYNSDIKPQSKIAFETGFKAIFFKDRLSVDMSYFKNDYVDGIVSAPVSSSTGFSTALVNTNQITTQKGVDLTVGGTPVKTKDWQWDIQGNIAHYASYYTRLDSVYSTKQPYIYVGARTDAFVSREFLTVPDGEFKGQYILSSAGRLQQLPYNRSFGNASPDFVWGMNTTIRYKNISLYMAMDGVVGGLLGSRTESYMWQAGIHPNSLTDERAKDVAAAKVYYTAGGGTAGTAALEAAGLSLNNYLVSGVQVASGSVTYDAYGNITSDTRTYVVNTKANSYKQYILDSHASSAWGWVVTRPDLYSNTFLKLRELSLTYHVPNKYLHNVAKSASVSFVGQNVFMWAKDFKYSDPDGESEDFADPSVRYLGFNIKLTF